jgi:8-oxo-dGTP diphosphatase / 2-hydroxy-dATP diphosphatase
MNKVLTLVIVHQHPRILLGLKKRGFGAGKWNGFGGKVEAGERIEDAARRELREEAGIEALDVEKMGHIVFEFKGDPVLLDVHLFRTTLFNGEPTETDEMKPRWFSVDAIPYADMWADDAQWMPLLLAGKKVKGRFLFEGHDTILEQTLQEWFDGDV